MQYLLDLIEYEKYQELAARLLGVELELLVFNAHSQPLWGVDNNSDVNQEALVSALTGAIVSEQCNPKALFSFRCNERHYDAFPFVIEDNVIAYLLLAPKTGSSDISVAALTSALSTIDNYMSNEYLMIRDLHSISEELTDRYEELNLVYDETFLTNQLGAKNEVSDFQSLAESCIQYLAVDHAVVTFPEKELARSATKCDRSSVAQSIITSAISATYPWVKEHKRELIINECDERPELNSRLDARYCYVASPITSPNGNVIGMVLLINPAGMKTFGNSDKNLCSVIARRAGKLAQTLYDDLTGIYRRSGFEDKIEFTLEKVLPLDEECSLIALNIQRTHVINETHGVAIGDAVICTVSQRIQSLLRHHDIMGRIGGDIFGVIARHCDADQTQILAAKLLSTIIDEPIVIDDVSIRISAVVSIVTMRPQDSASHLLGCLDSSLEVAAARGGDCVELYTHENLDIVKREEDVHWVGQIQSALIDDRFELYCQGIYGVEQLNAPHHYEVLLRLRDEAGAIVAPAAFLPAAQRYKLMTKIDFWVVENTIKYLASLGDSIEQLNVSWAINLSGQTLSSLDFPAKLTYWLNHYSLPAKYLGFEVTESETIDYIDKAKLCIDQLRAIGCDIYLDDFGTGLSSFSYLQSLDFDYVKIDGCFIKNVENDSVSRSMVAAICMVASEIGLKTVAEFVEDVATVPLLKSLGVTHLQGYGLHQPESINHISGLLFPEIKRAQGDQ